MKYRVDTCSVELSVGELCALAVKGGHIDTRAPYSRAARAAEGVRAHRAWAEAQGPAYEAEVSLCHTVSVDGLFYTVSGRADGLIRGGEGWTVDEVKTGRPDAWHEAQLKCYAHFLCERYELPSIRARLVYPRRDGGEPYVLAATHTREALRTFYLSLLRKIEGRARYLMTREVEWRDTMRGARFPYDEPRPGQHELMREVHRAVTRGERLFAEAPTGTGKTMSVLYPSLRALGEGAIDKIFYLTAKASTRRGAYLAAGRLFSAGARFRTVVLGAREQVCLCAAARSGQRKAGGYCNPVDCEYARGYYDRVEQALFEVLDAHHGYTIPYVVEVAKRYRLCPYEFSLDLSELCDVIVCDYNYAFDPMVYLRRYFDDPRERYAFLVDEAHNLVDRARDMYSARLCRSEWERVMEAAVDEPGLYESMEEVSRRFRTMKKLCRDTLVSDGEGGYSGYYVGAAPLSGFNEAVVECKRTLDVWLRQNTEHALYFAVYDLVGTVREYLEILEYYDDRFTTYVELTADECSVRLLCLSPAAVLDSAMGRAVSTVCFSATLTPLDYFADLLGGGKHYRSLSLPYPFDPENLLVAVVPTVSTRYEERRQSYATVAACLAAMVSGRAGHYMAYFPSYSYLEEVRKVFARKYPGVELLCQRQGMSYAEREAFIESFRTDTDRLRLGFCVLGGSFAEGIDLPGSHLIGLAIVGVGLPGLSSERNLLRDFFENRCEQGYAYAYTYPGMKNVMQAAGRVIRRDDDRGVVVLIDDRYGTEEYRALFPDHWQGHALARNASSLAEIVRDFWKKGSDSEESCKN